jgi:hypothetical protein
MQGRFIQSRILDATDGNGLYDIRRVAERAIIRSREIIRHSRVLLRKAHLAQLDLLCKRDALTAAQLTLRAQRSSGKSPSELAPRKFVSRPKWALGYVDGRARAFRRGNQPLAAVLGSIQMARRRGVSDSAIAAILRQWDLSWDTATGSVVVLPHEAGRIAPPEPSRSPALRQSDGRIFDR